MSRDRAKRRAERDADRQQRLADAQRRQERRRRAQDRRSRLTSLLTVGRTGHTYRRPGLPREVLAVALLLWLGLQVVVWFLVDSLSARLAVAIVTGIAAPALVVLAVDRRSNR